MELRPFLMILFVIGVRASNNNPDENAGKWNLDLFQGDIKLNSHQRLALKLGLDFDGRMSGSRGATAYRSLLWRNGVLPYTIEKNLASNKFAMVVINAAMKEWSRKTCIRFKKRTTEADYVRFMMANGCWSYIGCQGGRQDISLDFGCFDMGTVAHEIAHALGFHHEQARPDRDNYVTINYGNIIPGFDNKFTRYHASTINSLGVPYDYGSVMHYGSHYYSLNGQPTIVPNQSGVTIGQRIGPSYWDTYQMNLLYKCACKDSIIICHKYASKCWDFNYRWVRSFCPRTCALC